MKTRIFWTLFLLYIMYVVLLYLKLGTELEQRGLCRTGVMQSKFGMVGISSSTARISLIYCGNKMIPEQIFIESKARDLIFGDVYRRYLKGSTSPDRTLHVYDKFMDDLLPFMDSPEYRVFDSRLVFASSATEQNYWGKIYERYYELKTEHFGSKKIKQINIENGVNHVTGK